MIFFFWLSFQKMGMNNRIQVSTAIDKSSILLDFQLKNTTLIGILMVSTVSSDEIYIPATSVACLPLCPILLQEFFLHVL